MTIPFLVAFVVQFGWRFLKRQTQNVGGRIIRIVVVAPHSCRKQKARDNIRICNMGKLE